MNPRSIATLLVCTCLAACGGVVGDGNGEDTTTDPDMADTGDGVGDAPLDSDASGDPDAADTSTGDPDAPDTALDTLEDTPAEPGCGNGTVEECDDDSDFCVDCSLEAPSGWIACTDSAGNPAFLLIEDWAGAHTQGEFRDHCVSLIEAMGPESYRYLGLAVLSDGDIWDCLEPQLTPGTQYYVGLAQDTGASDYSEPDGGWYWMADDGSGPTDVAPFDGTSGPLPGSFDDGGGTGPASCGRIQSGMGGWSFLDYGCDSSTDWDGVCMIQY
jgi:hypothetical protein